METTTANPINAAQSFRLTVLNPDGRDPRQDYSLGINPPNEREHPPVNFHAYAACTRGAFHRETKAAIAEGLSVLLLLRGDFRASRAALQELKKSGLTTAISLKETGLHQIAQQLSDPKRATLFRELVDAADGFVAATPEATAFCAKAKFIPTPYPLDDTRWDFSQPLAAREGIFIGTREWNVPSRNHFAAVALAARLNVAVTLFDENPTRCRKLWSSLGGDHRLLRVFPKRLPYDQYLRELARHKIVLQADKSAVPGQVAGDALLCRMPCVGGDGAIERVAFPRTNGAGQSLGELAEKAQQLLQDDDFYKDIVSESQRIAGEKLSYAPVAAQLEKFFGELTR